MDTVKTTDQQLDQVFDTVNELMIKEYWSELDTILEYITSNAYKFDIHILVGWITATLAGKHKLKNRKPFLDKCRKLHPYEELWKGLD